MTVPTQSDYVTLLDHELKSCSMPKITDPSTATTEELVRDLHQVLTGNGNMTHGLIFKVASTNVNLKLIKGELLNVTSGLNEQIDRCNEVQEQKERDIAVETAAKTTAKTIGKALWDNKTLILLFVLVVLMYFNNLLFAGVSVNHNERLNKLIETKMEEFIAGKASAKAIN